MAMYSSSLLHSILRIPDGESLVDGGVDGDGGGYGVIIDLG